MDGGQNFFSRWFGFSGWRVMSAKARIGIQILYRVLFVIGLFPLIVAYGMVAGEDPGGIQIIGIIVVWYLFFQFFVNLIFIEGSKYSNH